MKRTGAKRRAAARAQRRRLIVPAALALFVGVPATVATLETRGVDVPGVGSVKSLLAMLEDRSPGERTAAELTKSKQKRVAEAPRQRALGKVHQPAPPKEFVDALAPPPKDAVIAAAAPPVEPVIAALAPVAGSPVGAPIVGGVIPGGGGGGVGGGGGGGGGGDEPAPGTTPAPTPTPVSAVPEPGTWAMMLMGFGALGMTLRRNRRRDGKLLLPTR